MLGGHDNQGKNTGELEFTLVTYHGNLIGRWKIHQLSHVPFCGVGKRRNSSRNEG